MIIQRDLPEIRRPFEQSDLYANSYARLAIAEDRLYTYQKHDGQKHDLQNYAKIFLAEDIAFSLARSILDLLALPFRLIGDVSSLAIMGVCTWENDPSLENQENSNDMFRKVKEIKSFLFPEQHKNTYVAPSKGGNFSYFAAKPFVRLIKIPTQVLIFASDIIAALSKIISPETGLKLSLLNRKIEFLFDHFLFDKLSSSDAKNIVRDVLQKYSLYRNFEKTMDILSNERVWEEAEEEGVEDDVEMVSIIKDQEISPRTILKPKLKIKTKASPVIDPYDKVTAFLIKLDKWDKRIRCAVQEARKKLQKGRPIIQKEMREISKCE